MQEVYHREGQEDQLGALGLVLNAVVLWNTLYIQQVFDALEAQGVVISDEDKARVSRSLLSTSPLKGDLSSSKSSMEKVHIDR